MRVFRCIKVITFIALIAGFTRPAAAAALSGDGTVNKPYDDGAWQGYVVAASPLTPEQGPVDEYFGKFKYSNLEVRNLIHDMNIEGNSPLAIPRQLGRIEIARTAIVDWTDKYPRDPWLRSSLLGFARLLQGKGLAQLDMTAVSVLLYMQLQYRGKGIGGIADGMVRAYAPNMPFAAADLGASGDLWLGDYSLVTFECGRRGC